ncbi:MAG: orotate phosphoribosyltransferase [candidate division WOR-3 bacterium]
MEKDLKTLLIEYQVLRAGHFLLTSGLHSDRYFEKFRILEQPRLCERFARVIADHYRATPITLVCGPTTGGVIVAYEVARQLGCRCIIAEQSETGRKIGRGFRVGAEDTVLIVDDVLTTGSSINETIDAVRATGARIVGIGVFIDRSAGVRLSVPLFSAVREPIQNYQPENCPLCKAGIPLETPGRSGKVKPV